MTRRADEERGREIEAGPETARAGTDGLSHEFSFGLDGEGVVTWVDGRASRLVALVADVALEDQVWTFDRLKARTLALTASKEAIEGSELTMRAHGQPVTVLLRTRPTESGAVAVGSLVPEDYQAMLAPLQQSLSEFTVLQRETQRQRRELERQRLALEASEAQASRLAALNNRGREQAEFLGSVARELHRSLNEADVAENAVRLASPMLGTISGVVVLGRPDAVRAAWVYRDPNDLDGPAAAALASAFGSSLATLRWPLTPAAQRAAFVIHEEETHGASPLLAWAQELGQSFVVVVAVHAPRTSSVGALVFTGGDLGPAVSNERLVLMSRFARILGAAFDNASLYREANLAAQMRADFIGIASHELRGPLTSLIGFSSFLARQARREAPLAPVREHVDIIHESAQRMRRTIDLFLSLAELDGASVTLDREPMHVAQVLEEEVVEAGRRYPSMQVRIDVERDVVIETDPHVVREILANLLDNAAKYGAGSPVVVTATVRSSTVAIGVHDQGPGIAPEDLEQLFERYYRGRGRPADVPGSGLGLYICRQMALLIGGTVTVESEVGRGSTFTLALPVGAPSNRAH